MKGSATTTTALVLYHSPCADGGFAAYVAHRALGERASFLPYDHRKPPAVSSMADADELYLLDCSGPSMEWVRECCARYARVVIVDHLRYVGAGPRTEQS